MANKTLAELSDEYYELEDTILELEFEHSENPSNRLAQLIAKSRKRKKEIEKEMSALEEVEAWQTTKMDSKDSIISLLDWGLLSLCMEVIY